MNSPQSASPSHRTPDNFSIWRRIKEYFISPSRTDLTAPSNLSPSFVQAQERVLTVMIRFGAVLGFIALLQSLGGFIELSRWDLLAAYAIPLLLLWLLALRRQTDYRFRAAVFLLLLYSLSLVELLNYGETIECNEYLLAFSILTTVFLGARVGLMAVGASLATLGALGWLISTGQFIPSEMTVPYITVLSLDDFIGTWLVFLMIVSAVNAGLFVLVDNLNRAWQREHEAVQLLQEERDLLEQHVAERTADLAIARDAALNASRYKTELMGRVSHELRTPLSAILGYTELMQTGALGSVTPKQHSTLVKVMASSYQLNDLVTDLLDQAQIERGQIRIRQAYFDPQLLANEIATSMQFLAEANGLTFGISIDPELPKTVAGDPKRIKQILTNLIGNAIKFTETGKVEARLRPIDQDHWAIQVTDTGPGIPLEARSQIFESFWQLDNSITRQQKGYGLGLSIVKQLTELMKGTITVESELGRGSTFTVRLPLALTSGTETTDTPPTSHDEHSGSISV